jgi:2-polyprenyl-6-methoxyphenol hydroxylase-like FAD-dependent oxidoreductase
VHKDPSLALGLCDAFRDVELLVDALDDGLSGQRPIADALYDYEQRRNDASIADFRENLRMAQFQRRRRRPTGCARCFETIRRRRASSSSPVRG